MARKKASAPHYTSTANTSGFESSFDREQQFRRKLELIVKTAARCFNEMGYNGTPLRRVAARLKVTNAALYYYVRTKEELAYLCYARSLDLSEAAIARARTEGTTGLEKLQRYIKYQVEVIGGPEGPLATLNELPALRVAHRAALLERIEKNEKIISDFLKSGVKDGSIRDCDAFIAANVIWGALNWVHKWITLERQRSVHDIAEIYAQVLTRGVASK